MAVDPEVLNALAQAVQDAGQNTGLEKALAAWLNTMSEKEISANDNKRHLESAKHAVRLQAEVNNQ